MTLSPMRYKGYTWPHNPRVYTVDYRRNMATHKTPFGLYQLEDLGRTNRIMEGEGEFIGPDAYRQFGQLANVFYQSGPGQLVHPLWQTSSAYFVSLRLMQEPRPDYVRYAFTFWEDNGQYSGPVLRTAGTGNSGSGGSSQPIGGRFHRVRKGESLWIIARKYGISLNRLIALNPQIKNPNRIQVGQEVRVG